ncbi:MAG: hypothetical protein LBS91_04615 [Clostridiales Family XIII bacterium]|jgi:uncharacterized protein YneF (UPF0154 family)|nr:hypothetical protein [Clostridiales Family XIII bacterium]
MALTDIMLAIVIVIFIVALIVVALIGYFKNWKGLPEETVVIPPAPPEGDR